MSYKEVCGGDINYINYLSGEFGSPLEKIRFEFRLSYSLLEMLQIEFEDG